MQPKDVDGMANTPPEGAYWSGTALFANVCLSENWGSFDKSVFKKTAEVETSNI